jgi:hypothetical protein
MSNQIPLIFNDLSNQIQEISALDNLDLTDCGITGVTNINSSGIITATDFNTSSDANLKDDVCVIENSLDKVIQINGVSFKWKVGGEKSLGVIAQNIEEVFPELVKDGEDHKSVNYNGLIGVLIEAVKELSDEVKELKERLDEK